MVAVVLDIISLLSSSEALTFLQEIRQLWFRNFAWAPKFLRPFPFHHHIINIQAHFNQTKQNMKKNLNFNSKELIHNLPWKSFYSNVSCTWFFTHGHLHLFVCLFVCFSCRLASAPSLSPPECLSTCRMT